MRTSKGSKALSRFVCERGPRVANSLKSERGGDWSSASFRIVRTTLSSGADGNSSCLLQGLEGSVLRPRSQKKRSRGRRNPAEAHRGDDRNRSGVLYPLVPRQERDGLNKGDDNIATDRTGQSATREPDLPAGSSASALDPHHGPAHGLPHSARPERTLLTARFDSALSRTESVDEPAHAFLPLRVAALRSQHTVSPSGASYTLHTWDGEVGNFRNGGRSATVYEPRATVWPACR
jgi:hypothetical protein